MRTSQNCKKVSMILIFYVNIYIYIHIIWYMSRWCVWRVARHQNSISTPHIVSHLEGGGDNCTNQGKQPPLLVQSENVQHCFAPEILLISVQRYASKLLGWWAAKGTSKSIAEGGMAESLRQHGVAFHPPNLVAQELSPKTLLQETSPSSFSSKKNLETARNKKRNQRDS